MKIELFHKNDIVLLPSGSCGCTTTARILNVRRKTNILLVQSPHSEPKEVRATTVIHHYTPDGNLIRSRREPKPDRRKRRMEDIFDDFI